LGGLDLALDQSKERLHRVEPGAVLGIEEHVYPLCPCCLEYKTVVVDACVVQQEHYAWAIEGPTISKALEELLDEVLEHRCVNATFHQLSTDDGVLSHACN